VKESHIPTLIRAQTGLKVGHIDLKEVRRGPRSLQRSISQHTENGEKIIVFDAVTDDDLNSIAEAGISMSPLPLMVGSAGLANQLPGFLKQCGHTESRPAIFEVSLGARHTIIIVSGSLSAVTAKQLSEVRRKGKGEIIPVDIRSLIEDQETGEERESEIVSKIISAAKASRTVGIQSVKQIRCGGQDTAARHTTPSLIVECLGRITFQIIKAHTQVIRGMILSGGDTALAVLKHLGISQVLLMDEILPGIPYGQVVGGEFAGLLVVTKAGAFGDESAFVKCIDFLERL
jgi:uncharacterized protein YgbK (DUF1537 family)